MVCTDKAPAIVEYKLLQLRQYLTGEALKTTEKFSYQIVKERSEREFGVIIDRWQFCGRIGKFEMRKKPSVKTLQGWMIMESVLRRIVENNGE